LLAQPSAAHITLTEYIQISDLVCLSHAGQVHTSPPKAAGWISQSNQAVKHHSDLPPFTPPIALTERELHSCGVMC